MKRKTIEEEINLFIEDFGAEDLISFFDEVYPLVHLYNIEDGDWVKDCIVDEADVTNVRIVRTVYLLSRIAETQSGKLCSLKVRYKDLWKRLEENK